MPVSSLTFARKLGILGALGLLSAAAVGAAGVAAVDGYDRARIRLDRHAEAQLLLRELDTRSSELKVDAYKAISRPDPAQEREEFTEDAEKIAVRLRALGALQLDAPQQRTVDALSTAFDGYAKDIERFITSAVRDQDRTRARWDDIQTANDITDGAIEQSVAALDERTDLLRAELAGSAVTMRLQILLALTVGALAVAALSVAFSRSTSRRVRRLDAVLAAAAGGDLTVRSGDTGADEVGRMSVAVDALLERFGQVFTAIARTGRQLGDASGRVGTVAEEVAASARSASVEAEAVAASAGAVCRDVRTAAAGTEHMESSISEIARNAREAAAVAVTAVDAVQGATRTMVTLGESSRQIGDVIRLITSIAEQTNLLALNATIEAARAGSAGKGFAVVADEVKQLAQETARATDDISRRVQAIQGDAERATTEISTISGVIERINEYQGTIARAVDEQTSTTRAMHSSLADAADGSGRMAGGIAEVAASTGGTAAAMDGTRDSAQDLGRMSADLLGAVRDLQY